MAKRYAQDDHYENQKVAAPGLEGKKAYALRLLGNAPDIPLRNCRKTQAIGQNSEADSHCGSHHALRPFAMREPVTGSEAECDSHSGPEQSGNEQQPISSNCGSILSLH